MDVHLYAVEYVDAEGDSCVKHVLATPVEAGNLAERLRTSGVEFVMHDLTGLHTYVRTLSPGLAHVIDGSSAPGLLLQKIDNRPR